MMTIPVKIDASAQAVPSMARVADLFIDDRPPGTVIGTEATSGALRLGCDVERQIAIDHRALRLQPLVTPGWGRQGIAYGPFRRTHGLVLAVSITNGHNTSQGTCIPEHIVKRIWRWAIGPNADPWHTRLAAWALGPRKKGTLRRFLWWMRSTSKTYKLPDLNENLAVGWFSSEAPLNPLADGCGVIVHAAEGENGELWVRVGPGCLSALRRIKNLQIYYIVALRERGAAYYAAAVDGAYGLAGFPMMRPIGIDPFNGDEILYAGIHQCVLGQIGFRVDTRVHGVQIEQISELMSRFGTAHVGDTMTGAGLVEDAKGWNQRWRAVHGALKRTAAGAMADVVDSLAVIDPGAPSGLVHALVEAGASLASVGFVWRFHNEENYWLLRTSSKGCTLVRVDQGVETLVAHDPERRLRPHVMHSVQILDACHQIGCYLDGERLFDAWFEDEFLEDATGVGVWFGTQGNVQLRDFEAHPREVPMPATISLSGPSSRLGEHVEFADDFAGSPGDLDRHKTMRGDATWEKTLGIGLIELDGMGAARVQASAENPNPGRTFYTLPWKSPDFADLEATITPPGSARGQSHNCRAGLVFWQDAENYLSFTAYLDDTYKGSSIALFTKRFGFEELYDAIWTMVWDQIEWGKPFRLRVSIDHGSFVVHIDNEPVMQRSLTDLYPDDPPLRITRVGLAVNWEWGNDTGSTFEGFTARR